MKKIAVLLTVHNRKEKTLKCLSELFLNINLCDYAFHVYLTDDGCTDGTRQAVIENFSNITIINGDGNLFWNRGMWTAWDFASKDDDYDYYFWLNDDTYLYEFALSELLMASLKMNNQSIIVGACQSLNHNEITYGGRLKINKSDIVIPNGEMIEIIAFNGNIVLVPRFVFEKVGNLNYYYRHSHGDLDYGLRASKKGIKMFQVGRVLGECDRHDKISKWGNPDIPLFQRLKVLYSPLGFSPIECFHSECEYSNFMVASLHFVTVHLRCLFPTIWLKYKGVLKDDGNL